MTKNPEAKGRLELDKTWLRNCKVPPDRRLHPTEKMQDADNPTENKRHATRTRRLALFMRHRQSSHFKHQVPIFSQMDATQRTPLFSPLGTASHQPAR